MKIVVVTGCLGFIGVHVTRALLAADYMVYGIDKETYAANKDVLFNEFLDNESFEYVNADIAELTWLPDCDYVINLAAESHVANSINDSEEFMQSNIMGVKNLLNLVRMKHANVNDRPVFFQMSTDEVYGDIAEGKHTETDLLCPSNPYSASKAAADMLIMAWARTYGVEYIILRAANNYGKWQYPEKLIPIAVKNVLRGKPIRLHNEGKPVRTWLHAEDTAAAIITIIESGARNEIFNVSGGFEQANEETVEAILCAYDELANCKDGLYVMTFFSPRTFKPYTKIKDGVIEYSERQGQDMRYALDDSKLRKLGWAPKKVFHDEIKDIVKHYMANHRW